MNKKIKMYSLITVNYNSLSGITPEVVFSSTSYEDVHEFQTTNNNKQIIVEHECNVDSDDFVIYNPTTKVHEPGFYLSNKQQEIFDEWKSAIKTVFGEYGDFEFTFSNKSGIGTSLTVRSTRAKTVLDLTDYDKW